MPLEFTKSDALTFGVELELMVLNTRDFNLTRGAPDLLARLAKAQLPSEVKPEITESMIEVNSTVHRRFADLRDELVRTRDGIVEAAGKLNLAVAGGGSHPFHQWSDRRIFPTERFLKVSALYGYLAKQFTVFGQHIHIGVESGDDAVYLTHRMARYIPHFIALSASSPFYQGEDTSFETSRLHAVSAFPLAGHLPEVASWDEFNRYFDEMAGYGIVASMKDFYWDIRPKPEFGTIEVRVMDTPLTVTRAAQLAALIQTLARWLMIEKPFRPAEDDYLVYTFNRFQACRFGLDGVWVDPASGEQLSLGDEVARLITRIGHHAVELGSDAAIAELAANARARRNDARWLREHHANDPLLAELVRQQCLVWADA